MPVSTACDVQPVCFVRVGLINPEVKNLPLIDLLTSPTSRESDPPRLFTSPSCLILVNVTQSLSRGSEGWSPCFFYEKP